MACEKQQFSNVTTETATLRHVVEKTVGGKSKARNEMLGLCQGSD